MFRGSPNGSLPFRYPAAVSAAHRPGYNKLSIGNGARYANTYPLETTGVVYDGQRKENDRKRVYILSRSAYAGKWVST
jgi:alpha-glucosidase (family GH31 glycosyl hydrolase)